MGLYSPTDNRLTQLARKEHGYYITSLWMAFTLAWCVTMTLALTGLVNINECGINITPRHSLTLIHNHRENGIVMRMRKYDTIFSKISQQDPQLPESSPSTETKFKF